MKLFVPVLALLAAAANAASVYDVVLSEWEAYKAEFGKVYQSHKEEQTRLKIFMQNKKDIAEHNKLASQGMYDYSRGINQFTDMEKHEAAAMMNGLKMHLQTPEVARAAIPFIAPSGFQVPKSIDWREKGAVTPIKDQGQCGSCWAFSTTGSLEGQHFRKTGKLVSLSEQDLVDCSTSNDGCEGGLMTNAFMDIKKEGGIDTESSYPYHAARLSCKFSAKKVGADDTGFVSIPEMNETALEIAVAKVGPVSIAVSADTWFDYAGGIFANENCSPTALDHGVTAVGFGVDAETGKEYWIVKNSWGVGWGENGYIRLLKGVNMCGVASQASYPLV